MVYVCICTVVCNIRISISKYWTILLFFRMQLNTYVVVLDSFVQKHLPSKRRSMLFGQYPFPYKKSVGVLLVDLIREVDMHEERIDHSTYFLTVMVLVHRLSEVVELDLGNCYWIVFLCFVIASKIIDDFSWSSAFWARRVSIDVNVFNRMERAILKSMGYRLSITTEDIRDIDALINDKFLTLIYEEDVSPSTAYSTSLVALHMRVRQLEVGIASRPRGDARFKDGETLTDFLMNDCGTWPSVAATSLSLTSLTKDTVFVLAFRIRRPMR